MFTFSRKAWLSNSAISFGILAGLACFSAEALGQVQVGQVFNSEGPGPAVGPRATIGSADNPPNGTSAGAIQAIAVDSTNPNTLYIGAVDGGIWKSVNGGASWASLIDQKASLSISSLSLDPTDATHRTLIAGTGNLSNGGFVSISNFSTAANFGGIQNGLLYSTDGGATFTRLGASTFSGQSVVDVAVRGSTILAATFEPRVIEAGASFFTGGFYRSTDGGATFTSGGVGLPSAPVSSLVGDPNNPNTFYATVTASSNATYSQTAVYKSLDAGATWIPVFTAAQSAGLISAAGQTSIKLTTGPGGTVAIGIVNIGTGAISGLFYTNTGGVTWTHLPTPNVNGGGQAPVNIALAIDPTSPNIVYVSGDNNFSNNGGINALAIARVNATTLTISAMSDDTSTATNTSNASTTHPDSRALAFGSNGQLLVATDGGLYARTNPQNNTGQFVGLNNFSTMELYSASFDANSKRLVIAAQDNGTSLQAAPGSMTFNQIQAGDGVNARVNDTTLGTSSAIYTTSQNLGGATRTIVDSQGNITGQANINLFIPGGFNAGFTAPLVLNNIDPSRLAAASARVFVTQDSFAGANAPGASNITLNLTSLGTTGQTVTTLDYGTRNNVNAIIAGAGLFNNPAGSLWLSTTATANSLVKLSAYAGLAPTSVKFDTRSDQRFFIADSQDLYGTVNQGASFQSLTANLPANFIRPTSVGYIDSNGVAALLVGGLNSADNAGNPLIVADSDAVGGLSGWRRFGSGLANTTVDGLQYNAKSDTLAVSTVGRGAWLLYDVTSNFASANVLQFGLANNDSIPDASILNNGSITNRPLIKYGSGVLTINGVSSYTGSTSILGGSIVAGAASVFAPSSAFSVSAGATIDLNGFNQTIGSLAGAGNVALGSGTLTTGGDNTSTVFSGVLSGVGGGLVKTGSGTFTLTNTNTYTGGTTVSAGTLALSGAGTLGGIANSTMINGATAVLDLGGTSQTQNGGVSVQGGGTLTNGLLAGGVTLTGGTVDNIGGIASLTANSGTTTLTGANAFSGATAVNTTAAVTGGNTNAFSAVSATTINTGGVLSLSGFAQTINALMVAGGTLTGGGTTSALSGAITSTGGTIDNIGGTATLMTTAGITLVTGANTYSGATTVVGGNLRVNGTLASDVTVQSSGTLSGIGSIGGAVVVQNGGALSAGQSPGTLTVASLNLNAGSTSIFELGAPGVVGGASNDLVNVTGNLSLGGTLNVNAPSAGYYRLFNYSTLTAGSSFATITGSAQGTPTVLTNVANQVNLSIVGTGQRLQFWDGADMTGNGIVDGGAGTWNATNTNWTGAPGQAAINDQWRSSVGVFAGAAAGTIAVVGAQAFDTLQFSTTGYVLNAGAGGQLQLAGSASTGTINTDGGITATINTPIVNGSSQGLSKVGAGTLILTGANTYTGGTTISAGTLQLGNGGTTGSIVGNVVDNATLAFNRSDSVTFGGVISGSGVVNQIGSGTTILTGANTYSGGTTISAGTLQLGAGGITGSIVGNVTNNATLAFNRSDAMTFGGVIAGSGAVNQIGTGTTTLITANTYTGGTTISAGTLQLGAGGVTGSIVGNVTNNATLAFNRSDAITFGGVISGTGVVNQIGAGTTTLTAANTYTGTTNVIAGTLAIAAGGSITSNVSNVASFINAGTMTGRLTSTAGSASNAGSISGGANISGSGSFANTGTLNGGLVNSATSTNGGAINGGVTNSNIFTQTGGTTSGGLLNTGTVNANGGAINGAISNSAAANFIVGGAVTSDATFDNIGSRLAVGTGGSYTLGGLLTNSGSISVSTGGVLVATAGGITNTANATITNNGIIRDDLNNAGLVTNNGAYVANVATNTGSITNSVTGAWTGNIASNAGSISNAGTWTGNLVGNTGVLVNSNIWTGSITTSGTFANAGGATVSGLVTTSGTTTNNGALNGGLINTAGTTNNSGSIGGTTTVSGGTLTGTGSVVNLTSSGGTFAPGNGMPGSSMTLTGNLTLAAATTYLIQINPTTSSFANAAGTATLGGATVNAFYANGSYVPKQYTILSATGGISGAFNTLANTNLPTNFTSSLGYDATHAYLNLALNFAPPPPPPGPTAPVYTPLTVNQANVANTLVNFFNTSGGIPLAFGALTPAGLTQTSGETAVGSQQTTFDAMNLFLGLITDPFVAGRGEAGAHADPLAFAEGSLAYAANGKRGASQSEREAYAAIYRKASPMAVDSFGQRWSLWAAGYGGSQTTDGNAALGSNSTTSRLYGSTVGIDYRVSPYTLAGIALAGGGTNFSVANGGTGRSDLFQAGAFVRHTVGVTYLTAALAYGWQDITTDRRVGVDRLGARFKADAFSGRIEGGYRFATPWMGITPYAAGQFTTYYLPAYAESVLAGANTFGLNYASKDVTASRSEIGLRTDRSFGVGDGVLILRGRAAWAHNFNPDRSIAATFQALPGASFVVNGAAQSSDAALVTASAEMKWRNNWSAAATFEGEFSDVTRSYAGKGVVRYAW